MSDSHSIDIDHHVKVYMRVFFALLVLTAVTVGVSTFHLGVFAAITLALCIALIKGGLVACYFMHLLTEQKLIYFTLAITVLFFFVLLLMPAWWHSDPIHIQTAVSS